MATCFPVSATNALIESITAPCCAYSPCEKFILNTFVPANIMARSTSGDEDAGPSVATIFVFFNVLLFKYYEYTKEMIQRRI